VWDWAWDSSDSEGDIKRESEEWHLQQHGDRISGFYDRAVTWESSDGRAFLCNRRLRYTKMSRFRVEGVVNQARQVQLTEVEVQVSRGPCDDGQRQMSRYVGVIDGGVLQLSWGVGMQRLVRRDLSSLGGSRASMATAVNARAVTPRPSAPNPALTGDWKWSRRTVDSDGNPIVETEHWSLVERGDAIIGFYDRVVVLHASGGYPVECRGDDGFERVTRYQVAGVRHGRDVTLNEIHFEARPSACDDGRRELGSYHGTLSEGEVILDSRGGSQVLRRVSPSSAEEDDAEGQHATSTQAPSVR
jgi:hypothetical protein